MTSLAPSRPASRSSIRETTSSLTASPAPLPLHPSNVQAQAQAQAASRGRSSSAGSLADENANPFLVFSKPAAKGGGGGLPFERLPTHPASSSSSSVPRKPRLSLTGPTPATAKDIVHRGVSVGAGAGASAGGHMKRLSTGSLRGEHVDSAARIENLEIRVRNYKTDCVRPHRSTLSCERARVLIRTLDRSAAGRLASRRTFSASARKTPPPRPGSASSLWRVRPSPHSQQRRLADLSARRGIVDSVCNDAKASRSRLDELVELYEHLKAQRTVLLPQSAL